MLIHSNDGMFLNSVRDQYKVSFIGEKFKKFYFNR